MWLWEGQIVPMPGESIEEAAAEAIFLARKFRAARKFEGSNRNFYRMVFNDQELKIYYDTTVKDVLKEYFAHRYQDYVEARTQHAA